MKSYGLGFEENNTKLRNRYFPEVTYQMKEFEGVNQIKYGYQDEEKDAVLIYKKIQYNKKEIFQSEAGVL